MKARTFHVTMTVDSVLAMRPKALSGLFFNNDLGRLLTGTEALEMARQYKAKGYTAIPTCDNHHLGICQGHPVTEDHHEQPPVATLGRNDGHSAGHPAVSAGDQANLAPADEPEKRPAGAHRRAALETPRERLARLEAQRDHLAALLHQCRPVMVSHARASHLTEGLHPKLNRWDALVDEIHAALAELEGPAANG